jgi:hypothetical protein
VEHTQHSPKMLHKKLHRQPQQDYRLQTYQGKKPYAAYMSITAVQKKKNSPQRRALDFHKEW